MSQSVNNASIQVFQQQKCYFGKVMTSFIKLKNAILYCAVLNSQLIYLKKSEADDWWPRNVTKCQKVPKIYIYILAKFEV